MTAAQVDHDRTYHREMVMPFGLGPGETFFILVAALMVYVVPLGAVVWALVTLSRLRSGQAEILARLSAIERRLGHNP